MARKLAEKREYSEEQKEEGRNKGTVISIRMVPLDAKGAMQTEGQKRAQRRGRTVEAHKVVVINRIAKRNMQIKSKTRVN